MTRIVELALAGGAGLIVGFLLTTLRANRIGLVHNALTELTGELTWFAKSLRDLIDPPEINATSPHGEGAPSTGTHAEPPPEPMVVTVVQGDPDTSPAGFPAVKLPARTEPSRRLPTRTVRADVLTKRLRAEQAARSPR